jgi:hypothetical protein
LGVVRIATHLHAEREHLPLMALEKIAERSAIPFARGQEKRVFGWGDVAFVCHVTSLAQLRAKRSSVCVPELFGYPALSTPGHVAISRQCRLYVAPSLCGSASATRAWFCAFAVRSFLAGESVGRFFPVACSPTTLALALGLLESPAIRFQREDFSS